MAKKIVKTDTVTINEKKLPLKVWNKYRRKKLYTDVQIRISGNVIHGHSKILAGASRTYTRKIKRHEKEKNKALYFRLMSPDEVVEYRTLIKSIYAQDIPICDKNLKKITNDSNYLNVPTLMERIDDFMLKNINENNVVYYYVGSSIYKFPKTREHALKILFADPQLFYCPYIIHLRSSKIFGDCLKYFDRKECTTEMRNVIFKTTMKWTEHRFDRRKRKFIIRFLKEFPLEKLSKKFYEDECISNNLILNEISECYEIIQKANQFFAPLREKDFRTCLLCEPYLKIRKEIAPLGCFDEILWKIIPKSGYKVVSTECGDRTYVIGGYGPNDGHHLRCFNRYTGSLLPVKPIPDITKEDYKITSFRELVIVCILKTVLIPITGLSKHTKKAPKMNVLKLYIHIYSTHKKLFELKTIKIPYRKKVCYEVTTMADSLYILSQSFFIRYYIRSSKWLLLPKCGKYMKFHSIIAHRGKIYALDIKYLCIYDKTKRAWSQHLIPKRRMRHYNMMVSYDDTAILIGTLHDQDTIYILRFNTNSQTFNKDLYFFQVDWDNIPRLPKGLNYVSNDEFKRYFMTNFYKSREYCHEKVIRFFNRYLPRYRRTYN